MNQRKKTMSQYYEFLGIIPGTLAENEIPPVIKKITDFFIAQKAEISYQDNFGRKKIAYPIKHLRHGYYFLLEFTLSADKLKSIEEKLKIEDNLLRFIIIKINPKSREDREKEKTRMQATPEKDKKERDYRDRGNRDHRDRGNKDVSNSEKLQNKISLDELDKKLDEILSDEKI
jgi:small subunit ribosomal protein S6